MNTAKFTFLDTLGEDDESNTVDVTIGAEDNGLVSIVVETYEGQASWTMTREQWDEWRRLVEEKFA